MAAQAALIADTILGMKRALRREDDVFSGPDDPITQPTNRGNKLRANAKYVREGVLGYIHPEELYKQKIEHAGYTRYILQRNPVRYDSEGEELDDDDEDSEADAAAAEENPFSEIALETLLCPLKHPSELPSHPSLSHAYTSKALHTMTQSIEAKLRQERALLWRARNLHRRFLGDSCWMPCGMLETPDDRWIFEPRFVAAGVSHSSSSSRYGHSGVATPSVPGASTTKLDETQPLATQALAEPAAAPNESTDQDVEMADVEQETARIEPSENPEQTTALKAEEVDATVADLPPHSEAKDYAADGQPNGVTSAQHNRHDDDGQAEAKPSGDEQEASPENEPHKDETEKDTDMQDGSSPEPPRRMTTRAQTNAANPPLETDGTAAAGAAQSPSPSTETASTIPTPHPLFLVPDSIRPDPNFGLPPNEAEETRRLLWSYIQKQEETVRGFEHMLDCLLRARRMKEDVWEWSKAEGHLGEMSDGEDWYDREKWGLAEGEDLKKGADEDEMDAVVDEGRATGKRGRGRRA